MRKTIITDEAAAGLLALIEPELSRAGLGEWTARARCAETDPEVFFPPKGDPGNAARAICAQCDVRVHCLAYATVRADDEYGIWGGLNRAERIRLRDAHIASQPASRPPDKDATDGDGRTAPRQTGKPARGTLRRTA